MAVNWLKRRYFESAKWPLLTGERQADRAGWAGGRIWQRPLLGARGTRGRKVERLRRKG